MVLISCSAPSGSAPTAPRSSEPELGPGDARAVVADDWLSIAMDGFRVRLPATWRAYGLSDRGTVSPVGSAPVPADDLEPMMIAAALQGAAFYASGPGSDGRPVTFTITAIGPDTSAAGTEVSEALRARLEADGISDLEVAPVVVDGRDGATATFRQVDGSGRRQQALTVHVPDRAGGFILSLATAGELTDRDVAALLDGFRFA